MARQQSQVGTPTDHGGVLISGASTCIVEGSPLSRIGDGHACPLHGMTIVATGSGNTITEHSPNSRLMDVCSCGAPVLIPCVKTFTN
jgi:uncharacterized Zn-binding protein involved in type VI secretion